MRRSFGWGPAGIRPGRSAQRAGSWKFSERRFVRLAAPQQRWPRTRCRLPRCRWAAELGPTSSMATGRPLNAERVSMTFAQPGSPIDGAAATAIPGCADISAAESGSAAGRGRGRPGRCRCDRVGTSTGGTQPAQRRRTAAVTTCRASVSTVPLRSTDRLHHHAASCPRARIGGYCGRTASSTVGGTATWSTLHTSHRYRRDGRRFAAHFALPGLDHRPPPIARVAFAVAGALATSGVGGLPLPASVHASSAFGFGLAAIFSRSSGCGASIGRLKRRSSAARPVRPPQAPAVGATTPARRRRWRRGSRMASGRICS